MVGLGVGSHLGAVVSARIARPRRAGSLRGLRAGDRRLRRDELHALLRLALRPLGMGVRRAPARRRSCSSPASPCPPSSWGCRCRSSRARWCATRRRASQHHRLPVRDQRARRGGGRAGDAVGLHPPSRDSDGASLAAVAANVARRARARSASRSGSGGRIGATDGDGHGDGDDRRRGTGTEEAPRAVPDVARSLRAERVLRAGPGDPLVPRPGRRRQVHGLHVRHAARRLPARVGDGRASPASRSCAGVARPLARVPRPAVRPPPATRAPSSPC